jgi:predicted kinase
MEMIIFVGCQAAGKSTFFREHFFHTHVRVNLDMLRTRNRERLLVAACLEMKQRFVVDNTNPTAKDRQRYFDMVADAGLGVTGYCFEAGMEELLQRNSQRSGQHCVPEIAVRATFKKFEPPAYSEGFDALYRVRAIGGGQFDVTRIERT